MKRVLCLLLLLLILPSSLRAQEGTKKTMDAETLRKVGEVLMDAGNQKPGEVMSKLKRLNPELNAVETMREFKGRLDESGLQEKSDVIDQNITQHQINLRKQVLKTRVELYKKMAQKSPLLMRSLYGFGDVGGWVSDGSPGEGMDVDWTILGKDPRATQRVANLYHRALLRDLGVEGELTLKDFDVVVTAEGHEAESGVFENRAGIDWAQRNMKKVTLVDSEGKTRTITLEGEVVLRPDGSVVLGKDGKPIKTWKNQGDPVGEMANAARMAQLRTAATKKGLYQEFFVGKPARLRARGDFPSKEAFDEWHKKFLEFRTQALGDGATVDFYRTRAHTVPGGCADMAKHLQLEALDPVHEAGSRLKKILKYLERANNMMEGAGFAAEMSRNALISDPGNQKLLALSRKITRASDDSKKTLIQDYLKTLGPDPNQRLKAMGEKTRDVILEMSKISSRVEFRRVLTEIKTPQARAEALNLLSQELSVLDSLPGEYRKMSGEVKSAAEHLIQIDAESKGRLIERYAQLETLRKSAEGRAKTRQFMKKSSMGQKLLENSGKILELVESEMAPPDFVPDSVQILSEVRQMSSQSVDYVGSIAMWAEVVDQILKVEDDVQLTIALSKTLVSNTYHGMVLQGAVDFAKGNNEGLLRMVCYMLCPEAALPALTEALAASATNLVSSFLFDDQLEAQYRLSEFHPETYELTQIADYKGRMEAARALVRDLVEKPDLSIGMFEKFQEELDLTEAGQGVQALGKRTLGRVVQEVVQNGKPLVFHKDPILQTACANIQTYTEELKFMCGKLNIELPLDAKEGHPNLEQLGLGEKRVLNEILRQRDKWRDKTEAALAQGIVTTFETRFRDENDDRALRPMEEELGELLTRLGILQAGQTNFKAQSGVNFLMGKFTSDKELITKKRKTLDKFLKAYRVVDGSRLTVAAKAMSEIGPKFNASKYEALMGYPALTGDPVRDLKLATELETRVMAIKPAVLKTMRAIRGSEPLPEDEEWKQRLFFWEYLEAYWTARATGVEQARTNQSALDLVHTWWTGTLDAEKEKTLEPLANAKRRYLMVLHRYRLKHAKPLIVKAVDGQTGKPVKGFSVVARGELAESTYLKQVDPTLDARKGQTDDSTISLKVPVDNYQLQVIPTNPAYDPVTLSGSQLISVRHPSATVTVELESEGLPVTLQGVPSPMLFGEPLTAKVEVEGGTEPYTYSWYLDDQPKKWTQDSISIKMRKRPGQYSLRVEVEDAKGLKGSARESFELKGAEVEITVLDAKTKKPVPGAKLVAQVGEDSFHYTCDSRGYKRLGVPPASAAKIQASAEGYLSGGGLCTLQGGSGRLTLELKPSFVLFGLIMQDKLTNAPISQVKVTAGEFSGTTDSRGFVSFKLPPETRVRITTSHDDYQPRIREGTTPPSDRPNTYTWKLEPLARAAAKPANLTKEPTKAASQSSHSGSYTGEFWSKSRLNMKSSFRLQVSGDRVSGSLKGPYYIERYSLSGKISGRVLPSSGTSAKLDCEITGTFRNDAGQGTFRGRMIGAKLQRGKVIGKFELQSLQGPSIIYNRETYEGIFRASKR